MRKRLLVTGIGVLVVVITLAGLMGVLNQLSNTKPTSTSGNNNTSSHTSGLNTNKNNGLTPGANPNLKMPSLSKLPAPTGALGTGNTPGLTASDLIPGALDTNPSTNGLSLEIPPQGGLPSHVPLFDVSGAANVDLLRSVAAASYLNGNWQIDPKSQSYAYLGERLAPAVINFSRLTTSEIKVTPLENFSSGVLPVPVALYPVSVSSSAPLFYFPDAEAFISKQGLPDTYSFQSIKYSFDPAILAKAAVDPQKEYLQLPTDISDRTKELAQQITSGIPSPYQKAKAIENFLKSNYTYDFDYKPAPSGVEPNDWFLFDEKSGVCSNFNSAFVVLARSVGIPSRLVSGYAISPTAAEQKVYADQAHAWAEAKFKDLGWITFDATGSSPGPMVTRTNITTVSPLVKKGHTFTVQGTVLTENSKPVDGVPVELFINTQKTTEGGTKIGQGTVSNGSFSIQASIPDEIDVGNYQLLAHSLGGVRYQHSWSDPPIKVTTETKISLDVPPRIRITEPTTILGKLSEESDQPVPGQTIDVTVGDQPAQHLTTDENGQFKLPQRFNQPGDIAIKAAYPGTDLYLGSSQTSHIQVMVPTVLKLQMPAKAKLTDTGIIQGSLTELLSGKPVQGQTIQVTVSGKPVKTPITTDKDGFFKVENAFDKPGIFQINASFNSVPYFWESQDKTVTEILPVTKAIIWLWPLIVTVLALAGTGGYFFWYRRRQLKPAPGPAAIPPAEAQAAAEVPPADAAHNYGITLSIEFPEIEPMFPDVWGVSDDLKVVCRLINSEGVPLAAKSLDFLIGKSKSVITTDADGIATLKCTFTRKGDFVLTARFNGEPGLEEIPATRVVRIVDYREEIVNLFNSLIDWLGKHGIDLAPEATPREIKQAILRSGNPISEEVLDQAILCFEEADYSVHPISRNKYKLMYSAQKGIREYEPTPAIVV